MQKEFLCSTDAPIRHGHFHETHQGYAWSDGKLQPTITPDLAGDIDARNGWLEPGEEQEALHSRQFEIAADLLNPILAWLASGKTLESIGRRAVVLVHALRPENFDGVPMRALAERFGGTKQGLSKFNVELFALSRETFMRSCGVLSAPVRRTYSTAQKKVHQAKGHKRSQCLHTARARVRAAQILDQIDAKKKACNPPGRE